MSTRKHSTAEVPLSGREQRSLEVLQQCVQTFRLDIADPSNFERHLMIAFLGKRLAFMWASQVIRFEDSAQSI